MGNSCKSCAYFLLYFICVLLWAFLSKPPNIMLAYTVQTDYNFTHNIMLYHPHEPHIFQCGERNNPACKLKFTWPCDSYTGGFHTCATFFKVLLACKSSLVTCRKYLVSGAGLSIYEVAQDWSECYKCFIRKCQTGVWPVCGLIYTCT